MGLFYLSCVWKCGSSLSHDRTPHNTKITCLIQQTHCNKKHTVQLEQLRITSLKHCIHFVISRTPCSRLTKTMSLTEERKNKNKRQKNAAKGKGRLVEREEK